MTTQKIHPLSIFGKKVFFLQTQSFFYVLDGKNYTKQVKIDMEVEVGWKQLFDYNV